MMNTIKRGWLRWITTGLLAAVGWFFPAAGMAAEHGSFRPGQPWLDTDGTPINAHGYGILKHAGRSYWLGSHKIAGKTESEKNEAGVRCYVSSDLLNWKGKFTGAGSPSGSGDFTIFQEEDGTVYHVAVRKPDKSLVCGRLSNDGGAEKSFGGQSTFVMPAPWNPDEWIAMFDIWQPQDPIHAGYLWLPLRFEGGQTVIRWQTEWQPGVSRHGQE
ncbi:hypothetical protein HQ447_20815 [bacterium]|nr:hypothetical protein [bacterium]